MIFKIIFVLLISILNLLRGWGKVPFLRRPQCIALMSILTGSFLAHLCHNFWLLFLCGVPMGICLGLHNQNRGVYALSISAASTIALLFTGHLVWYLFLVYIAVNYLVSYFLEKYHAHILIIDPLSGICLGTIVYLV